MGESPRLLLLNGRQSGGGQLTSGGVRAAEHRAFRSTAGLGRLWQLGLQPVLEQERVGHSPELCAIPLLRTGPLWTEGCVSAALTFLFPQVTAGFSGVAKAPFCLCRVV